MGRNERLNMDHNSQLEFRLEGPGNYRLVHRRNTRASRNRWWFNQIREAVNQAVEWNVRGSRPEQVDLHGSAPRS
jgi:hypothetical protein